jgi:phage gp29-like protein
MNTTATPTNLSVRALTSGQVATRVAAMNQHFMGLLLPNPDPILRAAGKQIATYRDIARDSHVGACIRRRKSAVKALEWGLDRGPAAARVTSAVQDMLAALDMEQLIGSAMDAPLYGYAPIEVLWQPGARGTWPSELVALPPEWFAFDPDGRLRFRTRAAPVVGELLPERKFLLPRQDASYLNPYGLGDLGLCYWPVTFKKGGTRFWLQFAEKFGSAFAVGKLPRSAEAREREALLADLEELVQNGVAVIPDDGSVALLEAAGKSASADLYESLVLHCRGEISIVLTGTNQSVEQDAGKASAHAGLDVAADLRDADAEIVAAAVNQLVRWVVEVNYPGQAAPVFRMWDQEAKDDLQARRDASNAAAGARFTNAYWTRAYGYQESDLLPPAQLPPAGGPAGVNAPGVPSGVAFADPPADPPDPTAAEQDALAGAAEPAWEAMLDTLRATVQAAPDLAAIERELALAYGGLDTAQLVRLMEAAYALAELKGMAAAQADAQADTGA